MMLSLLPVIGSTAPVQPVRPVVEVEETVYEYAPAENGAGPLWCYGSTCIVRRGGELFASGLETISGAKPLNNCRWMLFRRSEAGWQRVQSDEKGREREPSPLGLFSDGRLFLSTNPTLTPPDTYSGPANPHLLQFRVGDPKAPGTPLQPVWTRNPGFSEHSYRGLGVDGRGHELVVLNNYGYEEQYWSFLDRQGKWSNQGILRYPIRGCYPEVALVDRACHVLAIGDVVEPVEEWRKWKREKTGREWDYVFRRLFYVWNPNIATSQFREPLEIDNVDATAGHISNYDVWVDREGAAHLLYRKTTVANAELRDRFLPGVKSVNSLEHCVVRDGKVVSRETLVAGGEGVGDAIPGWARLHATEDGRLFVVYHCSGTDGAGKRLNENRLLQVIPTGSRAQPVTVPLKHPFTNFMTATERGGSAPSRFLDLFGARGGQPGIGYARVRLE